MKDVLSAYEVIRAQLARDEVAEVKKSASALQKVAGGAFASAPKNLRTHLTQIVSAAKQLMAANADDPDAVRRTVTDQ